MKKTLVFFLFSLVAAALTAQVTPNASVERDAAQFLIPVAGSVAGANGERFRTNLTIVNYEGTDQLVEVTFVPQSGAPVSKRLTIPYLTNLTFADIVGDHLGATGLGALVVTALNDDGTFDGQASLDGNARIWTPQTRGAGGDISSFVGAMDLHGWRNDSPAYIHGTRRTTQFRTSYGIVNLDLASSRRFRVIVNSGLGRYEETVELAPFSMTQRPVGGGYGDLSIYVEPQGAGGPWRAYGTSTDNATRSSWVVPAMQPARDIVFP